MAEIEPFQAFRYNSNRVALKDVLTQPYDKITPAMQERYYSASPYNLIQIEKGRTLAGDGAGDNVYTRAAAKLNEWIAGGILVQDAAPGVYIYSQEYTVSATNTRRTRTGFIALGRLEDYEKKVVFRHERTLSAPKTDRLELLRRMRAQTGQLFMLYDDPQKRIDTLLEQMMRTNTPVEMTDEYGVVHRLWSVFDRDFIAHVQQHMAEQRLVIADGHHRYETALNYRNECREKSGGRDRAAAYEFAMMTFINAQSKGLTILPTHRVVRNVADFNFEQFRKAVTRFFDWYSYPFTNPQERASTFAEFRKDLEERGRSRPAIGIYAGNAAFYLFLLRRDVDVEDLLPDVSAAQRNLDVVLLHRLVLELGLGITPEAVATEKNISYEREIDIAIDAVDRGEAQLACILNPIDIGHMMQVALGGEVLPQKSTDFYPKLLSGIAIYRVEGEAAQAAERFSGPEPLG